MFKKRKLYLIDDFNHDIPDRTRRRMNQKDTSASSATSHEAACASEVSCSRLLGVHAPCGSNEDSQDFQHDGNARGASQHCVPDPTVSIYDVPFPASLHLGAGHKISCKGGSSFRNSDASAAAVDFGAYQPQLPVHQETTVYPRNNLEGSDRSESSKSSRRSSEPPKSQRDHPFLSDQPDVSQEHISSNESSDADDSSNDPNDSDIELESDDPGNSDESDDSDGEIDSSDDPGDSDESDDSDDEDSDDEDSDDLEDSEDDPDDPDDPDNGPAPHVPVEDEPHPYVPPITHPTLRGLLEDGTYSQPINLPVQLSKGEALLMALSMARENNLSHLALQHVVGLLNSAVNNAVLPHSGYLLDKILNSNVGIERHFYCSKCFYYLGKLDFQNLEQMLCLNQLCNHVNIIKNLCKASYFLIFDVALQLKLMFENQSVFSKLVDPRNKLHGNNEVDDLHDLYDGSMYQEFARYASRLRLDEMVISLQLCSDASPLFKSSFCSITPVQLIVNELPPLIRMNNVILGALWFGCDKMPVDLCLEPLVTQLNTLGQTGFFVNSGNNQKVMKAFVIACCVDSGARGSIQGLKTHSGYCSCNWCMHPGVEVDRHVKFPPIEREPRVRTHDHFIEQFRIIGEGGAGEDGVNAVTPLMNLHHPPFDLVKSMSVEPLPASQLGAGRQFLYLWLDTPNKDFYIGSPKNLATIESRIKSLKPPKSVRRSPRPVSLRKVWKGREWENWILYFSLTVLDGILPNRYLKNWNLYVQAIYLLSRRSVSRQSIEKAQSLLNLFYHEAHTLYGASAMTFNVHINTHLPENTSRWGPLWAVSANAFEKGNGDLKQLVKVQKGVPHQICRVLSEKWAIEILKNQVELSHQAKSYLNSLKRQKVKKSLSIDDIHFLGCCTPFQPTDEERWLCESNGHDPNFCVVYKRVIIENCLYSIGKVSAKTNNSIVQLKNRHLFQIKKIVFNQQLQIGYLLGHRIHSSPVFNTRYDRFVISNDEACLRKIDVIEGDTFYVSIKDVHIVCVLNPEFGGNARTVVPLANIYNVM